MKHNHISGMEQKIKNKKITGNESNLSSHFADSNQQLNSIFSAAPIGIGHVIDRTFIRVNNTFCQMTGYDESELIGQNARIIYPSDKEYNRVGEIKYDQISRLGKGTIETKLKKKDGKIFDILMSSVPIDPDDMSRVLRSLPWTFHGRKNQKIT